jgi:hypothetical protein
MQTHNASTKVNHAAGGLEPVYYGVEVVRCPICQTTLVVGEQCPHGCRVDHRGRRQAPRRGLERVRAAISQWGEDTPFEPIGLEALAVAGELRGELVA